MGVGVREHRTLRAAAVLWSCGLFVLAVVHAAARASQAPATAASAGEVTLKMDAEHSTLTWTLGSTLHTVHGKFALKSGTLNFDPATGNASGEFLVSAASGESGND